MTVKKHTLIALVEDSPGVLNRIASLFRRRGYNIESLTVGGSEQPGVSRMTIVVDGTNTDIDQVEKQLYKLIPVLKVSEVEDEAAIERELALIKVNATAATRSEIMQIVDIFRAQIVDVATDTLIVQVVGEEDKIEALINLLRPFGVREMVRSGRVAMSRGIRKPLQVADDAVALVDHRLPPRRQRVTVSAYT
jgi:acetolactate synthase-1/3 small subunit